jgi:threonine/homoserine/homoserine lactone efflux protein
VVGAALVGFIVAVAALIGIVGPYVVAQPALGLSLRALCALLLARSSWRLWRTAGASAAKRDAASPADVLATTLVNPKGLIFAFAIFPPLADAAQAIEVFVRFAIVAVVVMSLWGVAGAALGQGAAHRFGAAMVDRAGAAILAAFSVVVLAIGFAG